MKRIDNIITEISLDDFLKLNLVGYFREWQDFKDEEGKEYRKLVWSKRDINKQVLKNMDWEENKKKTVVVAIHKNWQKAEKGEYDFDNDFYYYDKWLNKLGASTYLLAADVTKVYKGTNKWFIYDDYFDVPYDETEAIYFIFKKS